MARCELTGKGPVVKNLVSHSNIKTKSTAMANVQRKRLFSPALNEMVTLKLATSTIRSIEHQGGLDRFLVSADEALFSERALDIRRRLLRRIRKGKGTTAKATKKG
jgi:large subunit ribosomal protein L28